MTIKPAVRRYKDLNLVYDLDFSQHSTVVRQRIYRNEDESIKTPVTTLTLEREYKGTNKAPIARSFTPRRIVTCFENESNSTGTSELTTFIPYRPTDIVFKNHIREILTFPNVSTGFYTGELQNINTANYFA